MTNAVKLETENITKEYVTVRVYFSEIRYDEYNIKNDTPREMWKALIMKIRQANTKLNEIKKKFTLCKDLTVIEPFSIPEAIASEFFTKCKETTEKGKITTRI